MTNSLISKVEITVSCRNIMDKDVFSKSDPIVVLFVKHDTDKFVEYGRTEMILNNLNPDFCKSFVLDYYFEEIQRLKFQVYDLDSESTFLSDHDFLGEYECNLGELVSRGNFQTALRGRGITKGSIILKVAEIGSCKEVFWFRFSGNKLEKKGWIFSHCDPFLEVYRSADAEQYTGESRINAKKFILSYRTEHIAKTSEPVWKKFKVRNWRLCEGDRDRLLRLDCYNRSVGGSHHLIGSVYTSVNDLTDHVRDAHYLKLVKYNKVTGYLTLLDFNEETEYTFFDYISGGTQLHFTVSIDFTASNGQQNNASSLHYIHNQSGALNQYETAIYAVGSIIQDYDYDKMFSGMGFGARIPPNNEVSHCFAMNFCPNNPYCYKVENLLLTYQQAVRIVTLFGPTNFAPSIRHVQKQSESVQDGSQYFVLLIITDGIITDIDKTVRAIVDCSYLPMSIIIVGVGDEDFSAMDALDCDNGLLKSGSKIAERDIVQFVPMRDYVKKRRGGIQLSEARINESSLARAVLAELPDQVTQWMSKHNVIPNPQPHPATSEFVSTNVFPNSANVSDRPYQSPEKSMNYPDRQSQSGPYAGQSQAPYPEPQSQSGPYPGQGRMPYTEPVYPNYSHSAPYQPYFDQGQPMYSGNQPSQYGAASRNSCPSNDLTYFPPGSRTRQPRGSMPIINEPPPPYRA